MKYFNPLPPYGGRRLSVSFCHNFVDISIHSLRMEGDPCRWNWLHNIPHFNPLPPYGGRLFAFFTVTVPSSFQSTPSVWRETERSRLYPCREYISIHSLRMEGDLLQEIREIAEDVFQSTPSVWRETAKLHRKAFFISPILVQSCKKGCKRLHSAPEKMIFFEKREKNSVRNLQHLSVRL